MKKTARVFEEIVRWVARLFATAVFLLYVVSFTSTWGWKAWFIIGSFHSFLPIVLAGYLIGWKWEGIGGFTIVGGMICVILWDLIVNGYCLFIAFPYFYIPGFLYLLAWWMKRRRVRNFTSDVD